jgi:hypothetical protein
MSVVYRVGYTSARSGDQGSARQTTQSESALARFRREARAAMVHHSNVITIHDFGRPATMDHRRHCDGVSKGTPARDLLIAKFGFR